MKARIWTTDTCPYCFKAKKLLEFKGIEYEEVSGFSPEWGTVPYIEIDGQAVGGFVELAKYIRSI